MTYDSIKQSKRNWYHKNRESILLYKKDYRNKNSDKIALYKKQWNIDNLNHIIKYNSLVLKKLGISSKSLLLWSKTIKLRDSNECQTCGGKGQISHHILHKAKYPELALNINNGITLCRWCHAQAHNWSSVR